MSELLPGSQAKEVLPRVVRVHNIHGAEHGLARHSYQFRIQAVDSYSCTKGENTDLRGTPTSLGYRLSTATAAEIRKTTAENNAKEILTVSIERIEHT